MTNTTSDALDRFNKLDRTLIGKDTWNCEGKPVTPEMRREVLLEAARTLHEWEPNDRRCSEPQTMDYFFQQSVGTPDFFHKDPTYDDLFHDRLREYFLSTWNVTVEQMEEEVDPDWDGEYTAAFRTLDWLYPMKCKEVVEWYEQQKNLDKAARSNEGKWTSN